MMNKGQGKREQRVAIVHYWLVNMRGGERVVEELCALYPQADIFTLVCDRERISERLRLHRIITSGLQKIPFATRIYQNLLPLMPRALEEFDLAGYDIVISSESGPAQGVIVPPGTLHVSYVHSPMRYCWNMYHEYQRQSGFIKRFFMRRFLHRIRIWDYVAAQRPDSLVANSRHVQARIRRYWGRDSVVIHPPVDTELFTADGRGADPATGYFLFFGQLVPYKRADLAVRVFNENGLPLVVAGEGPQLKKLRRIAKKNIRFVGRVSGTAVPDLYRGCRALIFPGEEDFGIIPLEAQACGRPVIAYGCGGALETVLDGKTGLFFSGQTEADLAGAVRDFIAREARFSAGACVRNAARFSAASFRKKMREHIDALCKT